MQRAGQLAVDLAHRLRDALGVFLGALLRRSLARRLGALSGSVSYTHLTLPTSDLV